MRYVKRYVVGTIKQSYRSHPTAKAFVVNTNRLLQTEFCHGQRPDCENAICDSGTDEYRCFSFVISCGGYSNQKQ